jgi:uncharacterized protein YbcI
MTREGEEIPAEDLTGLGAELLQIHQESYGATAREVRVHVLEDAVVCFLDGLQLMPSEQFLIEAGRSEAVIEVRSQYQQAIKPTFCAAVERATGRRVVSFISATKLSPTYAVEIFRLAPERPPPSDDRVDEGSPGSAP